MPELGEVRRLDPRESWPNEARDFTPWLASNLSLLGERLGLDLELEETESPVGDFSIDILARDLGRDRVVVVENQLEPTNHTHLGQIITYAAGVEAGVVVWISREFREEHRQAVDWLNDSHGESTRFFGLEIELLQIDDSRPAANLKLVAAPNDWSTKASRRRSDDNISGRRLAYQRFFQRLIDKLREQHRFTNARAGQPQSWYTFSSGHRGFSYGVSFATGGRVRAELYVDTGDAEKNRTAFDRLHAEADLIRQQLGVELIEWEPLEQKRACRVAVYREASIDDPEDAVEEYLSWSIDMMLQFRRAFGERIAGLGV